MKIIDRNAAEGIVIGDNIRVTIISTDNGEVRIGIAAPRDVAILRSELLFRHIKSANDDRMPAPHTIYTHRRRKLSKPVNR
jgi:carbon storage regulator